MRTAFEILSDRVDEIKSLIPRLMTATVTEISPLTVDAGGESTIQPAKLGWWTPVKYQPIWLLVWAGKALALGAAVDQPALSVTGTIAATPGVGAPAALVSLDSGQSFTLPFNQGYTPTLGNKVWVAWSPFAWGQGVIAGRTGSVPAPQQPPDNPDPVEKPDQPDDPPRITRGTTTVKASEVRTWRGGGWRSDTTKAFQGDWSGSGLNTGYFFYGDGWKSGKGATVKGVEVWLRRRDGGSFAGEPMGIRRHTAKTRGSGQPTQTGSTFDSPGIKIDEGKWVRMDSLIATVQAIVNAGQGGIAATGVGQADYAAWAGISGDGRDSMSGAIRYSWERTG